MPRPDTDAVTQTLALIEPWIEFVPQQQRRLGLFIFGAFLLHCIIFYFVRIDSRQAELPRESRVHVSVETPRAIAVNGPSVDLFWDRLNDPRLFLLPTPGDLARPDAPASGLSLLNSDLAAKELPDAAAPQDYHVAWGVVTPLSERVEAALTPSRQPFSYDETPPAIATKTTCTWDAALAAREPVGMSDLPSPVSDTDLSPTVLQIAVGPTGAVEHVLMEASSGDLGASVAKDLDQQAELAAGKIRFQPTDQPGLVWGRVTIFWNYSAKPREEVVPTPPSAP